MQLRIQGALDRTTVAEWHARLQGSKGQVEVDLTDLESVDVAGLQLLWAASRSERIRLVHADAIEVAAQNAGLPPFWRTA